MINSLTKLDNALQRGQEIQVLECGVWSTVFIMALELGDIISMMNHNKLRAKLVLS